MQFIVITITAPTKTVSNKITTYLIENKFVSCVNVIPKIKSTYWWENKIYKKDEFLLICKSTKSNFAKIVKEVKKIHPYKVPEIICFDIKDGNKDYLNWIKENVL